MEFIHLTRKDYLTSTWAGGTTTQISIMPNDAKYAERDFLWRISSATVDLEESDFTPLPDYHRWIATIKGTMELSHNGSEKISLAPYAVHPFDGDDATHSWGKCTDFNLMLRKGKAHGNLQTVLLEEGATLNKEIGLETDRVDILCYCAEGSIEASADIHVENLQARESVLIRADRAFRFDIHALEHAVLFLAVIHY